MNRRKTMLLALGLSIVTLFGAINVVSLNQVMTHPFNPEAVNDAKYSLTVNSTKNKLTNENIYVDVNDQELELDSKSNKIKFNAHSIKNLDKGWQNLNVDGYLYNVDHIVGMDSISVTTSNLASMELYYSAAPLNQNNYKDANQILLTFENDGDYFTATSDFNGLKPNYLFLKATEVEANIMSSTIIINDLCKDFYVPVKVINDYPERGNVTGEGYYLENQMVNLQATANEGYKLEGWYKDGKKVSTSNKVTFLVSSATTYTIKFIPETYNVSIELYEGQGTWTGEGTYDYKEQVTVTAIPKEGYYFSRWEDLYSDVMSRSSTYTFTMGGKDVYLRACFYANTYNLEIAKPNGVLSVSGAGSHKFDRNVTVSATIDAAYDFDGWYDGDTRVSTDLTYNFKMPAKSFTLTPKVKGHPRRLQVSTIDARTNASSDDAYIQLGNQTRVKSIDTNISVGEVVTLKGASNSVICIQGWYDAKTQKLLSNKNEYTFTMPNGPVNIVAKFNIAVTVTTSNGSKPVNGKAIGGGLVALNSKVELMAIPNKGYIFDYWEDQNGQRNNQYQTPDVIIHSIQRDITLIPIFKEVKVFTSFYLGNYPKTKVTNGTIINNVLNVAGNPTVNDEGWTTLNRHYIDSSKSGYLRDVVYDNKDYRVVYNGNTPTFNVFEFKAIQWKIYDWYGQAIALECFDAGQQYQDDTTLNESGAGGAGQKSFTPKSAPGKDLNKSDIKRYMLNVMLPDLFSSYEQSWLSNVYVQDYNGRIIIPKLSEMEEIYAKDASLTTFAFTDYAKHMIDTSDLKYYTCTGVTAESKVHYIRGANPKHDNYYTSIDNTHVGIKPYISIKSIFNGSYVYH